MNRSTFHTDACPWSDRTLGRRRRRARARGLDAARPLGTRARKDARDRRPRRPLCVARARDPAARRAAARTGGGAPGRGRRARRRCIARESLAGGPRRGLPGAVARLLFGGRTL